MAKQVVKTEEEINDWLESFLDKWDDFLASENYSYGGEDDRFVLYTATEDENAQPIRVVMLDKEFLKLMGANPWRSTFGIRGYTHGPYDISEYKWIINSKPFMSAMDKMGLLEFDDVVINTTKRNVEDIDWYWDEMQRRVRM